MRALPWAVVAAAALVGCGGSPVDTFVDEQQKAAEAYCACTSVHMMTVSACMDSLNLPNEGEVQCANDWYDRNEDVAKAATECAADLVTEYRDCLEAATCNSAAITNCYTTFLTDLGLCPDLSASVQAELDACDLFGGP